MYVLGQTGGAVVWLLQERILELRSLSFVQMVVWRKGQVREQS